MRLSLNLLCLGSVPIPIPHSAINKITRPPNRRTSGTKNSLGCDNGLTSGERFYTVIATDNEVFSVNATLKTVVVLLVAVVAIVVVTRATPRPAAKSVTRVADAQTDPAWPGLEMDSPVKTPTGWSDAPQYSRTEEEQHNISVKAAKRDAAAMAEETKNERWIGANCQRQTFNPNPVLKTWKHGNNKRIHCVKVTAETPFAVSLYGKGRKISSIVAPSPNATLYISRQQGIGGDIEIRFEQADCDPPAQTRIVSVEIWSK